MTLARLICPAVRWTAETGFAHAWPAIDRALELGVGGFILFGAAGARGDELARVSEEIGQRAGRPLLLGADLERGAGQQGRGLTELPAPAALAALRDPAVVPWAGAVTGR